MCFQLLHICLCIYTCICDMYKYVITLTKTLKMGIMYYTPKVMNHIKLTPIPFTKENDESHTYTMYP